ncbi:MAG: PaaI family thioesterase [Gemmobacter sp.]|nr:PaaI family thioesterase [Gemmobacter sp.]
MNPDLTAAVRDSFDRQGMMQTLGGRIDLLEVGRCHISAPVTPAVSQQHGAGHAGLTFTLGDTAAGYAALTQMPTGSEVMTAEIKIHLLRPARGDRLQARGEVIKAGRRLTVVRADVFALTDAGEVLVAVLMGTMVPVSPAA